MTGFILGVLLVVAVLGVYRYGKRISAWWQSRKARSPYDPCQCGKTLTAKTAHRVVDRPDDEEEADFSKTGGGSALVADFCEEDCPGGCNRDHKDEQ